MLSKEEEYILQLIRSIQQGEKKTLPAIVAEVSEKKLDETTIAVMLIKLGIIKSIFPNPKKHPEETESIAQQEFARDLTEI